MDLPPSEDFFEETAMQNTSTRGIATPTPTAGGTGSGSSSRATAPSSGQVSAPTSSSGPSAAMTDSSSTPPRLGQESKPPPPGHEKNVIVGGESDIDFLNDPPAPRAPIHVLAARITAENPRLGQHTLSIQLTY